MSTLTREQAHELIDECGTDFGALLDLHRHWIGHSDVRNADLKSTLHEYVDEACASDEERERGPRDSDDTGLTDPDEPVPAGNAANDNAREALSSALRFWCAGQGLPVDQCADEMRTTRRDLTPTQRAWLDAFCTLWDATDVPDSAKPGQAERWPADATDGECGLTPEDFT